MQNLLCQYCSKECKRPNSLAIHVNSCKLNPDRKPHKGGFKIGHVFSEETKRKISWAGRSHSTATKEKISKSRIKFLDANPHMVPYVLNHKSKGESYPERYWREVLTTAGIEFEQELRVSRYRIDFAVGKIALEIDGEQHYVDERVKRSDKQRNSTLADLGWQTIRVRWAEYQRLSDRARGEFRIRLLEDLKQQS